MARTPLARRIARLTPLAAVAAAALMAPATAAADYPDGDGLVTASFDDGIVSVWPDGTNAHDWTLHGTVGTYDGSGTKLSLKTAANVVSRYDMATRAIDVNVPYDFGTVGATAMSPDGTSFAAVNGASLMTYAGAYAWNAPIEYAVGRFGWATQSGNQRKVYVAGPDATNGGGQDIAGTIEIVEQDGGTWGVSGSDGAQNATVSPDGRYVAFELSTDGQRDVYAFDTTSDGMPFKVADQTSADEYLPTFSPNSMRLVFARENGSGTEVREIPIVQVAASRLVHTFPVAPATGLAWQPSVAPTAGTLELDTVASPKVGTYVDWVGNPNGGYQPMTDTITWQRCPAVATDADGCEDIIAADAYQVAAADVGHRLRIRREVKNPAGSSTIHSSMTAVVAALPAGRPVFTKTPGALTNAEMPAFEWIAGENGGSEYECRVVVGFDDWMPDTGWAPCVSGATTPPLTTGDYTFLVRHKGADNEIAVHEFTVDQNPPAKPQLIMQKVDGLSASVSFTSGSNEIVTFECRLDGIPTESISPWTPCPGAWSGKDLAEGKHKLDIRAIDKAGNRSEIVTATWTNTKPVVKPEEPKPEPEPETPFVPQAPAVETPAPAAPAAAPAAETPKPVVTPVTPKAPALAVTIGGTKTGAQTQGGTSSAATIEVAKESVGVGCSITGTVLKSCKVDLYAPKAGGATARAAAAGEVLVGTGTYTKASGSSKMDVKVELNATGKAMLRKNPGGLEVSVKIVGQPVSGAPLKATGVAKLVTDRARATVGGFAVDSPVLTAAAKRQLRTLAKFGKAHTIRCVGHTDGSSDDESYLKDLGLRRAKAVCAYLTAHGAKGTRVLVSKGKAVPAATNTTTAGRAKNRRVQVTLVR